MLHPVILCGGSGTRLWPLSRKQFPKQFSPFFGDESLFQAALRRHAGAGFADPVLVAHTDFRFLAMEQAAALGGATPTILLEPEARNTGPAILSAALWLEAQGKGDDLMLVAPSDHVIRDVPAYLAAVAAGREAAEAGALVTFGITPDHAATGYGYLELDAPPEAGPAAARAVTRFVEKPGRREAEAMLASGRYLWNAGIFLFGVRRVIEAFRDSAPGMLPGCRDAVRGASRDLGFQRLAEAGYETVPADSIDYAVMEKAGMVQTVPMSCGWSDLGSWDAVWREMPRDGDGVAVLGGVTGIGCRGTLLRSEEGGPHLVGIGLTDMAVVAMNDAVLVAPMDQLETVKQAVDAMKTAAVPEAESFPRTYRPWGWYQTLARQERFQVKQIMVPPGRQLSLQSHVHRSEHWIVVAGTAQVTIDGEDRLVTENQSVYIPLGSTHRLSNPGKIDLHLIEVQTGAYLNEDDIIRYEDIYNRS